MGYLFVKPSTSPSSRGSGGIRSSGAALLTLCFSDIFRVFSIVPQTKQMPRTQLSVFPSDVQAGLQPSHISCATCTEDSTRDRVAFCTICPFLRGNTPDFGPKWHWEDVAEQKGHTGHAGGNHPDPASSQSTPFSLPTCWPGAGVYIHVPLNAGCVLSLHKAAPLSGAAALACPLCCKERGCSLEGRRRFRATPA